MVGILLALASATSWGAGDFLGGLASRKHSPIQVLFLTTCSSLTLMLVLAIIWGETFPGWSDIFIALLAGISGSLGLTALYKGLSMGNAALVSSVAGVVGAIIPTLVGVFIEGLPTALHLTGYTLALAGIWLVTQGDENDGKKLKQSLGLALLAGIGFGGFLAIIAQMQDNQVFAPLVIAKIASLTLALLLLRSHGLSIPKLNAAPIAIWSGFLDAGGNFLYLFATQYTRLDIAAVLSSLYPAGTVLLSGVFLKEKLSKVQWIGVLVCLCAISLVTWE